MAVGGIRECHEVRRIHVCIHRTRIEAVEQIRHADAQCHPFSPSKRDRDLFFHARIGHEKGRQVTAVVIFGDTVQVIHNGERITRPRFHRERGAKAGRQWKVSPTDKSVRCVPAHRPFGQAFECGIRKVECKPRPVFCVRINIRSQESQVSPNRPVESDFDRVIIRFTGIVEDHIERRWSYLCGQPELVAPRLLNVIEPRDPSWRDLLLPCHIPVHAMWVSKLWIDADISRCRRGRENVTGVELCEAPLKMRQLQALKRDVVVKESYAATYFRSGRSERQKRKTCARREIIRADNAFAVITQTQFHLQPWIKDQSILEERAVLLIANSRKVVAGKGDDRSQIALFVIEVEWTSIQLNIGSHPVELTSSFKTMLQPDAFFVPSDSFRGMYPAGAFTLVGVEITGPRSGSYLQRLCTFCEIGIALACPLYGCFKELPADDVPVRNSNGCAPSKDIGRRLSRPHHAESRVSQVLGIVKHFERQNM